VNRRSLIVETTVKLFLVQPARKVDVIPSDESGNNLRSRLKRNERAKALYKLATIDCEPLLILVDDVAMNMTPSSCPLNSPSVVRYGFAESWYVPIMVCGAPGRWLTDFAHAWACRTNVEIDDEVDKAGLPLKQSHNLEGDLSVPPLIGEPCCWVDERRACMLHTRRN
jgi:hypothetical protein